MTFQVAKVALIDDQGYYLLLERNAHPHFGNDPDLPGGTVEPGETLEEAAVREVFEESGIELDGNKLTHLYTGGDYSHHGTVYALYEYQLKNRPPVALSWEHAGYEWIARDEYLTKTGSAEDTFMHMVHDVVSEKNKPRIR